MNHATLSITAPSNDPDPLGGAPGSLQLLLSSSQPQDQIQVLVQSLPEPSLGGGSLGGSEPLSLGGRLSLTESLTESDTESLTESLELPDSLWLSDCHD